MTDTIGRFDYKVMRGPEDRPVTPLAYIILDHWHPIGGDNIAVSPQLTGLEVDGYIALLKADLDAVGARAKRALETAHQKNLDAIRARQSDD